MATTGRLTADQRTAILAGRAIVQRWYILRPTTTNHATYQTVMMSEAWSGVESGEQRILRAGSRKHEVWNPSPNVSRKPRAVNYNFQVSNKDKAFYTSEPDNFFYCDLTSLQNDPQECKVLHKIYVHLVDGSLSEITHMTFTGLIRSIRYEDGADPDGNPAPFSAFISCDQDGAWENIRRVWTVEDGTHSPLTGTLDYTWEVVP